jgi:circadian clock protein KaiC
MLWFSSREEILDQMAQQTLELVRSRQIRRLVIDGLHDIRAVAVHHQRLHRFFTALTNILREQGVTTLMSVETDDMLKLRVTIPVDYMSSLGENIMLLRTVEFRARLYRLISLLKMRRSNFDATVHTFEITEHGLRVAPTSEQAEQILAGVQEDHSRTA